MLVIACAQMAGVERAQIAGVERVRMAVAEQVHIIARIAGSVYLKLKLETLISC